MTSHIRFHTKVLEVCLTDDEKWRLTYTNTGEEDVGKPAAPEEYEKVRKKENVVIGEGRIGKKNNRRKIWIGEVENEKIKEKRRN